MRRGEMLGGLNAETDTLLEDCSVGIIDVMMFLKIVGSDKQ